MSCCKELCVVQGSFTLPSSATSISCSCSWTDTHLHQPPNPLKSRWASGVFSSLCSCPAAVEHVTLLWNLNAWIVFSGRAFPDSEPGQAASSENHLANVCCCSVLQPTQTGTQHTWTCAWTRLLLHLSRPHSFLSSCLVSYLCWWVSWSSWSPSVQTWTQRWQQLCLRDSTLRTWAQRSTSSEQLRTATC